MEEPLTPSLRADPLMVVCPTYREAWRMADDLGLRRQEWRHVHMRIQVLGRREGRYMVCGHGHEWPQLMMGIIDRLKDPTLGFQHLPHERVRKLVLRDRAAESE